MRCTDNVSLYLDLWPRKSPQLSIICVLIFYQSTNCKFWSYYDYLFSSYGPLGQHNSDWSRDLATLTFDLGGHGTCGWCGSSSSIRVQSLKFIGLAVQKIWHTTYVSINGLSDPDLWPFGIETGIRVASSKVGNYTLNALVCLNLTAGCYFITCIMYMLQSLGFLTSVIFLCFYSKTRKQTWARRNKDTTGMIVGCGLCNIKHKHLPWYQVYTLNTTFTLSIVYSNSTIGHNYYY